MKATVLLLCGAVAACAGTEPPPDSPSNASRGTGVTSRQAPDDAARPLTPDECASLGQWIVDACAQEAGDRSTQVESWCSTVVRGIGDGSWTTGDCTAHVRYMDAVCFRSTTSPRNIMDCDRSVERP